MTFAYFDTSAVVKRYVLEPGSLQVRRLLRQHDFLSSAITPLEILSALGGGSRTANSPKGTLRPPFEGLAATGYDGS